MKLNFTDTEVTDEQFIDDLRMYADEWVIEKTAKIYGMAEEIKSSPLLVNILHEWADGKRIYEKRCAEVRREMAAALLKGEEIALMVHGGDAERYSEEIKLASSLYCKHEYRRILDDAIFHNC